MRIELARCAFCAFYFINGGASDAIPATGEAFGRQLPGSDPVAHCLSADAEHPGDGADGDQAIGIAAIAVNHAAPSTESPALAIVPAVLEA